jgi:hypothetical protein
MTGKSSWEMMKSEKKNKFLDIMMCGDKIRKDH